MRGLSRNFRFDLPLRPKAYGFVSGQSSEENLPVEIILFRTPTQVNAPWILPPKADPPLAETQLLNEATPKPNKSSQAHSLALFPF